MASRFGLSHKKGSRDNMHSISRSSLTRIALATGHVGGFHKDVTPHLRDKIKKFLTKVIRSAVTYTEHARRKTVSYEDVKHALEQTKAIKIYGSPPTKKCETYEHHLAQSRKGKPQKSRRTSPKVSLVRKIKFYQQQHNCFHIAKAIISRTIREVGQDFKYDLRFEGRAVNLLHSAVEVYLSKKLKAAGMLSEHRGSSSLRIAQKDLEALKRVKKSLRY